MKWTKSPVRMIEPTLEGPQRAGDRDEQARLTAHIMELARDRDGKEGMYGLAIAVGLAYGGPILSYADLGWSAASHAYGPPQSGKTTMEIVAAAGSSNPKKGE